MTRAELVVMSLLVLGFSACCAIAAAAWTYLLFGV
jgi:hypothetical protein